MRRLVYFILAFVIWILLTWPIVDGKIDVQFVIAGVIASVMAAILFHEMLPREHHIFVSPVRGFWGLAYLPVFFYYVVKANFDVVYRALPPRMPIRAGI